MINLSLSNYENKSEEDLIKARSETKQKPETPKPKTKPKQIPKPETPKPKPKIRIKTNERKLKKLRKDFDELGHKFSKKEIKEYRKAFYLKTYIYYSTILKTAKLFGFLHHQALPIYK